MAARKNSTWVYKRLPQWAWDILSETLAVDMESGTISLELQKEISDAFETVENLILVSQNEMVLKQGDAFDIMPAEGGVIIRKKGKKAVD